MRVTDEMVRDWLVWARNFGEVVAYHVGSGSARRFRVRVPPGVTADGNPFRPREGPLDISGHDGRSVVPSELMLTAREALAFGMGCAAGRASALSGYEHGWQREWTPAEREAFAARREEARAANREEYQRERADAEAERLRRVEAYRRRKAGPLILEGGDG